MRFLPSFLAFSWPWLAVVALALAPQATRAQQPYGLAFSNSARVVVGADTLPQAWAGGFNSASYSKLDLDFDGVEDLYVHDQGAQRHMTFLAANGPSGWQWRHAPAYESAFPTDRSFYNVALRNYDADGRPDFFGVHSSQLWALYRNVAMPGGVGFSFALVEDTLLLDDGHTWLSTSIYGRQVVEDFDGDGDPDILDFVYGIDVFALYRNVGSVNGGAPRFHQEWMWSGLVRCAGAGQSCNTFAFPGTFCRPAQPAHGPTADYALCAADVDGDGDRDLLIGQQYCRDLTLLENTGTDANPLFAATGQRTPYPAGPPAATLVHTPAATYLDLTFDGQPDLLVTPWLTGPEASPNPYVGDQYDTRHTAWLYRRTGAGFNGFAFERDNFLQNQMIDVGNQSAPTLGDLDGDGDLDLLVANQGDLVFTPAPINSFTSYRSKLAFYRNVGTPQRAVFRLENEDFSSFSNADKRSVVPVLTDLDGNGTLDLVVRYSDDRYGGSPSVLGYILNTAPAGQLAAFPATGLQTFTLSGTILADRMVPSFFDADGDGDRDMLIGTQDFTAGTGAVKLFENRGGPLATAFVYNPARYGVLGYRTYNPAPAVLDLNGDGAPELLTASDDGDVRVWPGWLQSTTAPPGTAPISRLLLNDVSNFYGPGTLGARLVLTSGDLDADGTPEVLVGTAGGGVRLLRHQPNGQTGLAETGAAANALRVYPNPAATACTAELLTPTGDPLGAATFALRDALGRLVWHAAAVVGKQVVPLAGLAPGVYALTATTPTSRAFTRRLSVVAP